MSSSRRPWFPWYPKDYVADEKTRGLSDDADLLYRRILDVIWQANDLQLPSICSVIANQIARGWTKERFENAWFEIQRPGFELLKTSKDGKWITSNRLLKEAQKIENISKIRSDCGRKAKAKQKPSKSQAKAKQKPNHPDPHTHTDITKIKQSAAPSGQPPADNSKSKHFEKIEIVGKHFKAIKAHCDKIMGFEKRNGFNPFEMVQKLTNQKCHPGAIESIMSRLADERLFNSIGKVWPYVNSFWRSENGNFNERDSVEIHEWYKSQPTGALENFTLGLLKSIE